MRVALLALVSALFAACVAPVYGQDSFTIAADVATMNYALALEALEAAFYGCRLYPLNNTLADCNGRGYAGLSQDQFTSEGFNSSVWQAVNLIAQQEISHRDLLNSSIQTYNSNAGYNTGIPPVSRCLYNVSALGLGAVTNVASFLSIARAIENVGVSAYAGAVNTITDPGLLGIAVSIADVEARHAAWLNALLGVQPFASSGFDTATVPSAVATNLNGVFLGTNCVTPSSSQSVPAVRPYGVAGTGANTSTTTGSRAASSGVTYSAAQRANDLLVLNYALTLEQLEASFYNAAGAVFNQASFTNAGLPTSAFTYFGIIGQNENTHVAALRAAITAYGGTPVANCSYNFTGPLSSFQNYLNYAQLFEDTGVFAYTGAAGMITDTNLLTTAATITMIEARHAAYIRSINNAVGAGNGSYAFPNSRDAAAPPSTILSAVTGLRDANNNAIVYNCPSAVNSVPTTLPINAGIPSSTAGGGIIARSSSGPNGASSTTSLSLMMVIVAIIASLALLF